LANEDAALEKKIPSGRHFVGKNVPHLLLNGNISRCSDDGDFPPKNGLSKQVAWKCVYPVRKHPPYPKSGLIDVVKSHISIRSICQLSG